MLVGTFAVYSLYDLKKYVYIFSQKSFSQLIPHPHTPKNWYILYYIPSIVLPVAFFILPTIYPDLIERYRDRLKHSKHSRITVSDDKWVTGIRMVLRSAVRRCDWPRSATHRREDDRVPVIAVRAITNDRQIFSRDAGICLNLSVRNVGDRRSVSAL